MPLKRIGTIEEIEQAEQPSRLVKVGQVEQPEKIQQPEERPGILGSMWEGYKTGASMAAEAAAVPVSGMAGLAKYISESLKTGSIDKGLQAAGQTIEQIQQAAANLIPAETGKEEVGKVVQKGMEIPGVKPVVETAMKVPEAIGDISYEGALKLGLSPETASFFGGVGKSIVPAAIEILGSPGLGTAKKSLLKKAIQKSDITDFYDEAGNLIPEIKTAIRNSDLSPEDIEDFIPQNITQSKQARETIESISEASQGGLRQAGRMEEVARKAKPSKETWEAAQEFGLAEDIPISHLTAETNPLFASVNESIKSVPTSILGADEITYYKNLANKAQGLVEEFGGTVDKSSLSSTFRSDSVKLIDDLTKEANIYYDKVEQMVDPKMVVNAQNTVDSIMGRASRKIPEGGDIEKGINRLPPFERKLLKELQSGDVTYDTLDGLRKDIGDALFKKSGPFANRSEGLLKDIYKQLSKDQFNSLPTDEAKAVYNTARTAVAQRKAIEKQLTQVIGKEIGGDITTTAENAVKAMSKGKLTQFNKLAKNIPKDLGKETRQSIFATALNDVMTLGSRKEKQLNIPGFDDFMNGLNQNKAAKTLLAAELPPGAMDKLDAYHGLVSAARKAKAMETTTGKLVAAPAIMDEVENIWSKAYGIGKPATAAMAMEMGLTGSPGLLTLATATGTMAAKKFAKRTKRSVAADKLLSSKKFRNILKEQMAGNLDTATKVANANKMLEKIAEYRFWKKNLPPADAKDLAAVGALGYFTGRQKEEPAQ